MAITIRIIVNSLNPLDGVTPLPQALDQFLTQDADLGMIRINLPAVMDFGRFDPGQIVAGQSGSFIVSHLSVISQAAHQDGSVMRIRPPALPGGGSGPERTVLNFGPPGDQYADGVVPEGLFPPLPVGHQLIFDTLADGPASGPHVIQLTLVPATLEREATQRQTGVSGGGGGSTVVTSTFVYRPGGVPSANVYNSWPAMLADMALVQGPKVVEIDDSIVSPAIIPTGTWNMRRSILRGREGPQQTVLRGSVDTVLTNAFRLEQNLQLQHNDPDDPMIVLAPTEFFDLADGASLGSLTAQPVVELQADGAAVVRMQQAQLVDLTFGPAIGVSGGVGKTLVVAVYEGSVIDDDTIVSDVGSAILMRLLDLGADVSRTHALLAGTITFGNIPMTGSVLPTEDNQFAMGTRAAKIQVINNRLDVRVAGTTALPGYYNPAVLTYNPDAIGEIMAFPVGYGDGICEVYANPGGTMNQIRGRVANFDTYATGSISRLRNNSGASWLQGATYMFNGAAGDVAEIDLDAGLHSFLGGAAYTNAGGDVSLRHVAGSAGSFTWCYLTAYGPYQGEPIVEVSGLANDTKVLVGNEGRVYARNGTSMFRGLVASEELGQYALMENYVDAFSCFLHGRVEATAGYDAIMRARDDAGWASGRCSGGLIETRTGQAAWARGWARDGASIYAQGHGSTAWGYAPAGAVIGVAANNADQWGVGVNAVPDSTRFGVGIRVKKTLGPPAAPANGDIWQTITGDVIIHSGGADRNCTNIP